MISKFFIASIVFGLLFFNTGLVWGQNDFGGSAPPSGTFFGGEGKSDNNNIIIKNPLAGAGINDIPDLIGAIIRWLNVIVPSVLTLMIIVGAFQIMTAAGNVQRFTLGKNTITYAVLGYALFLLASGVVYIIKDVLITR